MKQEPVDEHVCGGDWLIHVVMLVFFEQGKLLSHHALVLPGGQGGAESPCSQPHWSGQESYYVAVNRTTARRQRNESGCRLSTGVRAGVRARGLKGLKISL